MKGSVQMRFVPIDCISEGSILAKTVYDTDGRVLLTKGFRLSQTVLKRVEQNGIMSLYINDGYSDSEIEDFIRPELRQQAIKTVKESLDGLFKYSQEPRMWISRKQNTKIKYQYIDNITKMAGAIIDELMMQKDILISLVDIKSIDNYTYEHSINVTVLALVIGIELKYDRNRLLDLAVGSILHDIGKVLLPKEVLQKADRLTDEEYEVIKRHPVSGFEYLKENSDISMLSRYVVLQHHERVDGTGYPYGIKGDKIHEYGKIVSIADVYDALTSDRPYRMALSPSEALEFLMGAAGRYFDFNLVKVFIGKVDPYPVGTLVRLSNGYIGVIQDSNTGLPLRPKVKVISINGSPVDGVNIDLVKEKNIVIEGIQYATPEFNSEE